MGIPSKRALQKRNGELEDRIKRLRDSYDNFLREWEKIEKEEYDLLQDYHGFVDKNNILSVLQKINSLK